MLPYEKEYDGLPLPQPFHIIGVFCLVIGILYFCVMMREHRAAEYEACKQRALEDATSLDEFKAMIDSCSHPE